MTYRHVFTLVLAVALLSPLAWADSRAEALADPDLVGWWRMEESSGTAMRDTSGFGNHGSFVGSPGWTGGQVGLAAALNGSTYGVIPDDPDLDISGPITLAAWIQPSKLGTQYVIKKATQGATDGYEISLSSSGLVFTRLNQASSGNTHRVDSTTPYPTSGSVWMHVASTYDGATLKIYINGVEEGSVAGPAAIATNNLSLGIGAQWNAVSIFQGSMDEVRIYRRALSGPEIQDLMDTTAPTATLTAPNGGEVWSGGSTENVTWMAADDLGVDSVDLDYSTDSGGSWTAIASGIANTGTYPWTVPAAATSTARVRVVARDAAGNTTGDMSDADFTIQSPIPSVTVIAPNGGESWPEGSMQNIDWVASDDVGVTAVDLDYSIDSGGSWISIAAGLANTGTYAWTVPSTPTFQARVRVTAHDGDANSNSDTSDADFSITGLGPVGWWPMEEGGGPVILDASAFGNDGNLQGAPGWVTGVTGLALDLDGTADWASVPDDPSLDITDAITLATWIRPEKQATQYLVKKATQSGTNGYELSLSAAGTGKAFARFNQASSGNAYRIDALSDYPKDGATWMHLAVTYDGATIRLYVDGAEEANLPATFSIATNNLPLGIGAQSDGASKFQGAMDDVRVYSRALDASEIADLAGVSGSPPVVTLTAPNGGEVWPVGSAQNITWSATDDVGVTSIDLEYSTDGGGSWTSIATGLANTGTFPWTVPDTPTSTARVRATAHDADLNSGSDMSDADFFIQATGGGGDLVGWWPMEEDGGPVILDASGLGNDGALQGAPAWVPGVYGLALDLDGLADYALVPDDPTLDISGAITIATWIRPEKQATQYVVKKAIIGVTDGYELSLSTAGTGKPFVRFNQATSSNAYRLDALSDYPKDGVTWMHLAVTYDGSVIRFYVDGVEEANLPAAFAIATNSLPLGIGAQSDGATPFQGAMDDVRLYGRALSTEEIESLADNTPPVVTVTAPNGGETLLIDSNASLEWTATDDIGVEEVDILLSRAGSSGPFETIASAVPNDGSYSWLVTEPVTSDAYLKVVARDAAGNSGDDLSDGAFTIEAPVPVVLWLFEANGVNGGIELRWQFDEQARFATCTVERGYQSSGPWMQIPVETRREADVSVALDRNVVDGQSYHYRLQAVTPEGEIYVFGPISGSSGSSVTEFFLAPVMPNPAVSGVNIRFELPRSAPVRLSVYDVRGRQVAVLAEGTLPAGRHVASWDGRLLSGERVASGAYVVLYQAPGVRQTQRLIMLR